MDPNVTQSLRIGYKASAEQFDPGSLLTFAVLAEELGFESVALSDHFQPWRHHSGHAPAALPWLGSAVQATRSVQIGTSVLTPTLRYHPSVVAQAFATLACMNPGRIFLGVGTGESMNETPATGAEWPGAKERRRRLAESIRLMRELWTEERVDFDGEYYQTKRATIYDRPDEPVPIYIAASGPLAAKLVGRAGDGFICTSGKNAELYEELIANLEEAAKGAGRDPMGIDRLIEIKVSYDTDPETALRACEWWGALALKPEQKMGVEDPLELENLADENVGQAHTRFIVSTDPREVVDRIQPYIDLGFRHLLMHGPGADQERFLRLFAQDVLPLLRERGDTAVGTSKRLDRGLGDRASAPPVRG
ncbi:MAG: glucose-6-phosphate dehydrogenase (coenzyme-F420) [Solirubrobacterales bacterium]